jgi:acetylornithine deacetylase/succinyl-diaminopimelate desuccinylase-like protein
VLAKCHILHAPNEKFRLPDLYRGIEAVAKPLEMLAE